MSDAISRSRTLAAVLIVLAGCRTPSATDVLAPRSVGAISPGSGAVSHELIPDSDSPQVELGPDEEFVRPQLDWSNRPPSYPPALVPLRLPPHVVALRVTFDEMGRTTGVAPSPIGAGTESQHRAAFEAAAEQAVRGWHCSPAQIRKFRPGPDADGDGKADYQIMADMRTLKTYFDVAFTFQVVDGVPVVSSGPPK